MIREVAALKNKKTVTRTTGFKSIVITLLITAFCMICMSEVSFLISSKNVSKFAVNNYDLLTEQKSILVNDWYLRQKDVLENQVFSLQKNGFHKEYLSSYLADYVNGYIDKYVYDIYYTDINNKMVSGSGFDNEKDAPDVDFTKRLWFINALASNDVVVSTAYKDVDSGHLIITLSKKVYVNGKVNGVLALDVFIESLEQLFTDSDMPEKSYGFLVDEDMGVIIHPYEAFSYDDDPHELTSVGIADYTTLKSAIKSDKKSVSIRDYDGVQRTFYIRELEDTGWYTITAIDNALLDKETKALRNEMVAAAAIIIVLSLIIEAVLRSRNVHKVIEDERKNEQRRLDGVINSMMGEFETIMSFNYDDNSYYAFKTDESTAKLFSEADYNVAIRKYGEQNIIPDDFEHFIFQVRRDNVFKSLMQNKPHIVKYRTGSAENPSWHELRFANFDPTGKKHIAVIGIRDITSEVTNEQLLQAELQDAKNKAEEANKAKSTFLFNMSHDIRTPMNAIIGFNEMARKYIDNKEKLSDCLEKVEVSSHHLLKLINDVLDMARIENGKVSIDVSPVDVTDCAGNIVSMCGEMAKSKNISLELKTDGIKTHMVYADEIHVNQVILNVLSNAVKYTNPGGRVVYTITQIDSDVKNFARYVFSVKDNGIGMSKEYLDTIFEAFSRERNSTHTKVQGTGLGMSIVKKLVDLLDGSIEIISEEGKGTEVIITLPFRIYSEKGVIKQEAEESALADLNGKRILLVEDNQMNREIAAEILEDEGAIIETAEDGDVAVDMVKNAAHGYYDCVLMDIQMPRMNGYEATALIREFEGEEHHTPIIALSANAFEEDKVKSIEAGLDDHISKPIDLQILLKTLAKFI